MIKEKVTKQRLNGYLVEPFSADAKVIPVADLENMPLKLVKSLKGEAWVKKFVSNELDYEDYCL